MAIQAEIYEENVAGVYFVDMECISCDTCGGLAPGLFRLTADHDHAFVARQPVAGAEVEKCEEALRCCPVGAIGKNP